jgi:site-specific recombinase XerD
MKRAARDPLLRMVESYINDHLRRVRGASAHTVRAYSHALRLFFMFLARCTHRPVDKLLLDDITVDNVLAFLTELESARGNTASTRNCRLAAVRGFVEHLLRHDIQRAGQYQRVLTVRSKKSRTPAVDYLEPEHVRALLAEPDRRTARGTRDYALLVFLYNTGARISEALAVTPTDLHLAAPRYVRLHGKGGKERICPLWRETAQVIARLAQTDSGSVAPIFRNARGNVLTRDGAAYLIAKYVRLAAAKTTALRRRHVTPHVLRHSCAVALLQAGVDITVIRDYLGHASITTTSRYISTNVEMKREALDAFWRRAGIPANQKRRWRPKPDVIAFLASL